MKPRELSRCPHCGARGVKVADDRKFDGVKVGVDYCGQCGRNWPPEAPTPRQKVVTFRGHGR